MKNKRYLRMLNIIALGCVLTLLSGCQSVTEKLSGKAPDEAPLVEVEPIPEPTPEPTPEEVVEETVEGCYRSELTGEWIPEELKNQRPIAVMVDNETFALPHFGVNSADVVYEIMNSTANDRITRLMCIVKDYNSVEQLGSVRSTRPTNFMLAAEYNAILLHDGGPFYNDEYYAKDYVNNLSGGFARFNNGKSLEFTEYITPEEYTNAKGKTFDGLNKRIDDAGYSREYNEFYPGEHFTFSTEDYKLSDENETVSAKNVELPFYHNSSKLTYNESTGTYDYYEYGNAHIDELTGQITSFKNVILQGCSFAQLDENGYLIYNVIGQGDHGYYLTNGEAIPIMWIKDGETAITQFTNTATGQPIVLNVGKTYIGIVPDDTWEEVVVN
ncbi:MAG: DUF3048 domain-containing protein [Lachnospiraceae bacterium]|nr:DUF3048 domain-containing protein [Lachnospiraceae bacterium]